MTSTDETTAHEPDPTQARTDLDALDLRVRLTKDQYRSRRAALQRELFELQRAAWKAGLGTLVIVEGWDTADKAGAVRKLTDRLEPRGFQVHAIEEPRSYEAQMPWLWRFWNTLPAYGQMAIYERSWYRQVILERLNGGAKGGAERLEGRCEDVVAYERALAADRYLVVKLFLHVSKKERKRRLRRWELDPENQWRVDDAVWRHHERYPEAYEIVSRTLAATDSAFAPWTLVAAEDRRWARIQVLQTLRDAWTWRLGTIELEAAP